MKEFGNSDIHKIDLKLNELAHNIGMERQHKKLTRHLLIHLTQECYHMGYEEGFEDHKAIMFDERHAKVKEKAE